MPISTDFPAGKINQSQSLFTYAHHESVDTYSKPDFEPMFADNITWHNDSLRQKAEEECGDDHECLFDVASTNDLSVGMVTKDILVNETNTLGKLRKITGLIVHIKILLERLRRHISVCY